MLNFWVDFLRTVSKITAKKCLARDRLDRLKNASPASTLIIYFNGDIRKYDLKWIFTYNPGVVNNSKVS